MCTFLDTQEDLEKEVERTGKKLVVKYKVESMGLASERRRPIL